LVPTPEVVASPLARAEMVATEERLETGPKTKHHIATTELHKEGMQAQLH